MRTLWQDLRYGLRGLANRPSFALLAILNLALGIGAATTIFSVIQGVLVDPFPYADARRVAMIQIHDTTSSRLGGRSFFQVPEFLELQSQNHVFDDSFASCSGACTKSPKSKSRQLRRPCRHTAASAAISRFLARPQPSDEMRFVNSRVMDIFRRSGYGYSVDVPCLRPA